MPDKLLIDDTPLQYCVMKRDTINKQVKKHLTDDEIVEKSFNLRNRQVYATNRRILVLEGRTIRDFDYTHISSIAYSAKRLWWLIIIGFISLFGGTYIGGLILDSAGAILFLILGIALLIMGLIFKAEKVEATVIGLADPVSFTGSKKNLDSLLQLIRQKRDVKDTTVGLETRVDEIADAIRKLADLRDDGLITQEEFEDKKRKLLS